ncbi:glycosyltransferase, partial [Lactobacillus helveticus]|nr:glycosyltransferase [Lactobacillus helveticus]
MVSFISKGRVPIFVGNGNNNKKFLGDNTGDNI